MHSLNPLQLPQVTPNPSDLTSTLKKKSHTPSFEYCFEQLEATEKDTVESLVDKIQSLLLGQTRDTVQLSDIDHQTALAIRKNLKRAGLKHKFDWYADSSHAVFRMPGPLHSATMTTWALHTFSGLQADIEAKRPCPEQTLMGGGDTQFSLTNKSSFHPDASFIMLEGVGDDKVARQRVIIEVLVSQSLESGRQKAEKYLLHGNYEVSAVILIKYEHVPRKGDTTCQCKCTIHVFSRTETGDIDIDWPLDMCPWRGEPSSTLQSSDDIQEEMPHPAQTEPDELPEHLGTPSHDVAAGTASESNSPPSLAMSWGSQEHTRVEELESVPAPSSPGDINPPAVSIRGQPIVVYDESLQTMGLLPEHLLLDIYDFCRLCNANPAKIHTDPEERAIRIPLRPLREATYAVLRDLRRELGITALAPNPYPPPAPVQPLPTGTSLRAPRDRTLKPSRFSPYPKAAPT